MALFRNRSLCEPQFAEKSRYLFSWGFDITSKCRMASIELDDAMILPHAANLDGSNSRKEQRIADDILRIGGIHGRCAHAPFALAAR